MENYYLIGMSFLTTKHIHIIAEVSSYIILGIRL